MKLEFLGTGGGRFTTLSQVRWTGGFKLEEGCSVHIDPGPGALRAYRHFSFSPNFSAIFLSHNHLDHVNDVNALVEVMTKGCTKRRGIVFGEKDALDYITPYHRSFVELKPCRPGEKIKIEKLEVEFTATKHGVPGLGAIFRGGVALWYSGDTEILEEHYSIKPDIAVLNVLRPWGEKFPGHMNSEQAAEWGLNTKPKLIIIQHFGRKMLNAGPERKQSLLKSTCFEGIENG